MTNKPLFLLLFLLVMKLQMAFSQTNAYPRREFKLGYGVASGVEGMALIGNVLGTTIGVAITEGVGDYVSILVNGQPQTVRVTKIENKPTLYGSFMVNYNKFVANRLSLGIQGSYTPMFFKNTVYYSNNTTKVYSDRLDITQLYGRFDFHYIKKPRFQMYSGLMAGGLYVKQYDILDWAFHANLLGFRFGQSRALYAEFGLGFSSFVSAGYSARF